MQAYGQMQSQARDAPARTPAQPSLSTGGTRLVRPHTAPGRLEEENRAGCTTLPDLTSAAHAAAGNCALPTPGCDFGQIPIQPLNQRALQPKLAVNAPGDRYEREADYLADQVMRRGDCACAMDMHLAEPSLRSIQRSNAGRSEAVLANRTQAPPIVHEVLRSAGQPLDPATRSSMEARFGHDFSQVRVHHDQTAADSAKSIHALAYAVGNHIAFGAGQYVPDTDKGKRLLAHELVHTLQQGNHVVHRKVDFTDPTPVLADPIPHVLGGRSILGNTRPGLNGRLLPANAAKRTYQEAVFNALQAQSFKFSDTQNGKTCKVNANGYNINVFAEVRAITEPQGNKWSGSYPSGMLSNPPSNCVTKEQHNVQIDMEGKPNSAALYRKVLAHEQEHVADLKRLTAEVLKPHHDYLVGLTGSGKTEEECVGNVYQQVGNKDALAAASFVDRWLDAVQVYDREGGTHHSRFATTVNADCTTMSIKERN